MGYKTTEITPYIDVRSCMIDRVHAQHGTPTHDSHARCRCVQSGPISAVFIAIGAHHCFITSKSTEIITGYDSTHNHKCLTTCFNYIASRIVPSAIIVTRTLAGSRQRRFRCVTCTQQNKPPLYSADRCSRKWRQVPRYLPESLSLCRTSCAPLHTTTMLP